VCTLSYFCFVVGLVYFFGSSRDRKKLVDVKETEKQTTLCLAAAHALVRLDDGTIVGDPMEKTTLEALDWKLSKGAFVSNEPPGPRLNSLT
jgi:magnesium-transporting ATPase (P-type)